MLRAEGTARMIGSARQHRWTLSRPGRRLPSKLQGRPLLLAVLRRTSEDSLARWICWLAPTWPPVILGRPCLLPRRPDASMPSSGRRRRRLQHRSGLPWRMCRQTRSSWRVQLLRLPRIATSELAMRRGRPQHRPFSDGFRNRKTNVAPSWTASRHRTMPTLVFQDMGFAGVSGNAVRLIARRPSGGRHPRGSKPLAQKCWNGPSSHSVLCSEVLATAALLMSSERRHHRPASDRSPPRCRSSERPFRGSLGFQEPRQRHRYPRHRRQRERPKSQQRSPLRPRLPLMYRATVAARRRRMALGASSSTRANGFAGGAGGAGSMHGSACRRRTCSGRP
mmetsp:Transcript_86940/g.278970  ORF Transcript_86940/g.278970 Transcript_86940/m.278970 type:complete len:336 (-) Transcript_86940:1007-2014(-)